MVGMLADPSECRSRVVLDGDLTTSRSLGTAMEFALGVVKKLLSPRVVLSSTRSWRYSRRGGGG
jgi:hypothetical protein